MNASIDMLLALKKVINTQNTTAAMATSHDSLRIILIYPTDPSREIATSACASIANSIGSACNTSL
ncbi:MAG: hypothetical protein OTI35_10050, partial [Sulfitobacter sp.]|nr:hypothetical protein [Sulfitobacter sp.]